MKSITKIKIYLTQLTLVVISCFIISCNATEQSVNPVLNSDGKSFQVSFESKVKPLPLNSIHSWLLHVNTRDGKPVEKASILVYGGMPAHKHGLPTSPKISEIGNGDYLLEGIKFSMTGKWVLWLEIRVDDITDSIKIDIDL